MAETANEALKRLLLRYTDQPIVRRCLDGLASGQATVVWSSEPVLSSNIRDIYEVRAQMHPDFAGMLATIEALHAYESSTLRIWTMERPTESFMGFTDPEGTTLIGVIETVPPSKRGQDD